MHRLAILAAIFVASLMPGDAARRAWASPQARQAPLFSTRADLVVLHVTVIDRKGRYIAGLTPDAFTVYEDGQRQAIDLFSTHDAPVTTGLIVDDSGSMYGSRDLLVAAAATFAQTSNPEDEIFALAFNDSVRAALPAERPFTGDATALSEALTRAIVMRGRTALHDAIGAGLDYLAKGTFERKVLIVVSDGGDNASGTSFEEIVRRTQISNTLIFSIAVRDPLSRDANPKRLRQIAEATGGLAFEPDSIRHVEGVLRRIASDIRHTYTIGYAPVNASRDGGYRRIRVDARGPDGGTLRVRTRQGYIAAAE